MEQTLGLMAGAGALPGRVAAEAARQGWRVVAFAFGAVPNLAAQVQRVIPCELTDLRAVLEHLQAERVKAVVFSGQLPKGTMLLKADAADDPGHLLLRAAGGLSDAGLAAAVVEILGGLGIELLDQRTFLASLFTPAGVLTRRVPSEAERQDIRFGFRLARQCAEYGVGQTVVVARGVALAVEAIEGTSATIERGCRLAGPGAVVVKAPALQHDYRFDVPTIGLETLEVMTRGQARALAIEARRVAILDREAVIALADRAGIAITSVDRES